MSSASPLTPTYQGHIASTQDALLLFEGCLGGTLNHVARRPHDRERTSLIKSGNIFIYEEHSSGIKRWTDGVPWSPSRILGNFLVYRELERPFPPGEKKRAMKKGRRSPGVNKPDSFAGSTSSMSTGYSAVATVSTTLEGPGGTPISKETERALIGSLVDSYGFKEEGLVKKTVSVSVGNVSHHLVSYYTVADVMNLKLQTPSKDPRFAGIVPRHDLLHKQNFRTPIDEIEPIDRADERNPYSHHQYARSGYELTNQSMAPRQMSLPNPQVPYNPAGTYYPGYNQPHSAYPSVQNTHPNDMFNPYPAPAYGPVKSDGYDANAYRQQNPQHQPHQQPRYNSVAGIGGDLNRGAMPLSGAGSNFTRRGSNYEQVSPVNDGLAAIGTSGADPRMTGDQTYPTSQSYYGPLRDNSQISQQPQNLQLRLPNPDQQGYDRASAPSYTVPSPHEARENQWSLASANSGHGHAYPNQQQTWGGATHQ